MSCTSRPTLCKSSAEELVYTMDFTNPLKAAGDTLIASIDSVSATPTGLTISGQVVSADAKQIQFKIVGGTDLIDYEIDGLVTTTDASTQKLMGKALLKVRD